jgi:hypothetical protein
MCSSVEYYGLAVDSMRAAGRRIDDGVLAHISPAHSENINLWRPRPAPPAPAGCSRLL